MAQRYNRRHAVHIFAVGDMVSLGISRDILTNLELLDDWTFF